MSLNPQSHCKIILAFGEGGHAEQMRRLSKLLGLNPAQCISIVDKEGLLPELAGKHYILPPLRDKFGFSFHMLPMRFVRQLYILIGMYFREKPSGLISTGPGICLLPAILMRLRGGKVVYIETWCRFRSRSLTGKIMYIVANRFYVQNESLLELYPKAVFGGRL